MKRGIVVILALLLLPLAFSATPRFVSVQQDGIAVYFSGIPEETTYTFITTEGQEEIIPSEIVSPYEEQTIVYFEGIQARQLEIDGEAGIAIIDIAQEQITCGVEEYQDQDPACLIVLEQPDAVRIEQVVRYDNPPTLYVHLANTGATTAELSEYSVIIDWKQEQRVSEKPMLLEPGKYFNVVFQKDENTAYCGKEFFIGLLRNGEVISSTHNTPFECIENKPVCGDKICSKYEDTKLFRDCPKDCENPINLEFRDVTKQGLRFDFTFAGEFCRYHVYSPTDKHYTTLIEDAALWERHQMYTTLPPKEMFGELEEGDYRLRLECTPPPSTQEITEYACLGCFIGEQCVPYGRWFQRTIHCTEEGEVKHKMEVGKACDDDIYCYSGKCKKNVCANKSLLKWLLEKFFGEK